jgi:hypothetical protein
MALLTLLHPFINLPWQHQVTLFFPWQHSLSLPSLHPPSLFA